MSGVDNKRVVAEFVERCQNQHDLDGVRGARGCCCASSPLALASASEVLVSSTVRDLVAGSGLQFEDRGSRELKGVPDPWRVLALIDG